MGGLIIDSAGQTALIVTSTVMIVAGVLVAVNYLRTTPRAHVGA